MFTEVPFEVSSLFILDQKGVSLFKKMNLVVLSLKKLYDGKLLRNKKLGTFFLYGRQPGYDNIIILLLNCAQGQI